MPGPEITRRRFVGGAAGAVALAGPWAVRPRADAASTGIVRFGLCADVHKDIIHDADRRMDAFVAEANRRRPDFLLQLGDFCVPKPENRDFYRRWEAFAGPRYHVLGNHDVDGGYTWEQTLAYYGMERRYYSFDAGGCHFVVLDGNERGAEPARGYPRFIGADQLRWLAEDLAATDRPTVVFSHQSLENPGGVTSREQVRAVLEGSGKVVACLSGHHHIDYQVITRGIAYVQINSMSYYWVGSEYARRRFDEATERAHPALRSTVPYRDPLYTFVTVDPSAGLLTIEGARTAYVEPGPDALGMPAQPENNRPAPAISDRRIAF